MNEASQPTLFDELMAPHTTTEPADLQTPAGLLALTALPGVGSGRAIRLARAFRSLAAFNDASVDERRRVVGAAVEGQAWLSPIQSPDESVRLLGFFDPAFPSNLKDIKDPPAVLWVRGQLPDPQRRIAIVGTRAPTSWGLSLARVLARQASEAGVSVVSGLALGIDIAAHREAMSASGHTTAILGSGIDRISPREHMQDAENILESGGCLVTEQPPGTQPSARTLVARNRIQSGISAVTVVVQCGEKSGTLSTARFTVEQGRTLALPVPQETGERSHPENAGSIALMQRLPAPRLLRTAAELQTLLDEIG